MKINENIKKSEQLKKDYKIYSIIDIYYREFPLRFKNNKNYFTSLGFIMGLISIILFIILSISELKDIFLRKNFGLISNTEYSQNAKVNLTNIPIFFALFSSNLKIQKINVDYMINVIYEVQNISGTFRKEINVTQCNYNELKKNFPSIDFHIQKESLELLYCIDTSEEINIFGNFGDKEISSLSINLFKCVNISEINTCSNPNDIQNSLLNSYFFFAYLEQNIDNYNYRYPISYNLRQENIQLTTSILKKYNYYFSRIEFLSDDGLLFENVRNFSFFNYDSSSIDISIPNNLFSVINPQFGSLTFYTNNKIIKIKRNYRKLPDGIANIEGIINIIYFIINFIVSFFTNKMLMIDIVNTSLFPNNQKIYLKSINHSKFINNEISNNTYSLNNKKNKSSSNNRFYQPQNNLEIFFNKNKQCRMNNINNLNNNIKFYNEGVTLKLYQYFLPFFIQKKNKKVILLEKYCDKIYQCISIENLFQKLELKNNKIT